MIKAAMIWQRELSEESREIWRHRLVFTTKLDSATLSMFEGIISRIEAAERINPNLRLLKEKITAATIAVDEALFDAERKARQSELDTAIQALNREIGL